MDMYEWMGVDECARVCVGVFRAFGVFRVSLGGFLQTVNGFNIVNVVNIVLMVFFHSL